jgi:hypothetical protein
VHNKIIQHLNSEFIKYTIENFTIKNKVILNKINEKNFTIYLNKNVEFKFDCNQNINKIKYCYIDSYITHTDNWIIDEKITILHLLKRLKVLKFI